MADDRPGPPEGDRPEERPATSPTEPVPPPPGVGPGGTTPLPPPPAPGSAPTTPVPEPPAAGGPPGYGQPAPPAPPGYGSPPPGAAYGGQPGYGPPGYGTQPGYGYPAGPPTDSSATAALVIAIVGFFICPPVGAVVALVMANSAEKRIEASEGRLGGLELARAARIIAIVELVLTAILIVGGILAIAASLGSRY